MWYSCFINLYHDRYWEMVVRAYRYVPSLKKKQFWRSEVTPKIVLWKRWKNITTFNVFCHSFTPIIPVVPTTVAQRLNLRRAQRIKNRVKTLKIAFIKPVWTCHRNVWPFPPNVLVSFLHTTLRFTLTHKKNAESPCSATLALCSYIGAYTPPGHSLRSRNRTDA